MKPEHETVITEVLNKSYDLDSFMGRDGINASALIGNDVGDIFFGLAQEILINVKQLNISVVRARRKDAETQSR